MSIRALVIDDEKKAREGIRILLAQDPDIRVLGEARDGREAIEKINVLKPDLVFLDIQMPGINGFDVLGSLTVKILPLVIFSTAYDQYAIKAFDVRAIDYLLKPYSKERFEQSLQLAKEQFKNRQSSNMQSKIQSLLENYQREFDTNALVQSSLNSDTQIIVKSEGKIRFLNLSEVYWIEAMDSYVKIHLDEETVIVKSSLKSIETKYGHAFLRIHKSSLVNRKQILLLEPFFKGDFYLKLRNNERVKGSRNYRKNLPEVL